MSESILKRVLLFFAIYLGFMLLAHFTPLKSSFAQFYRSNAKLFFSNISNGGEAVFKDNKKDKKFDTMVTMSSQQQKNKALAKAKREGKNTVGYKPISYPVNTWNSNGLLFIFFLSILLASPLTWKRRLSAGLIGFLVLYLFMTFKQFLSLYLRFSHNYERMEVGSNNSTVIGLLEQLHNIVTHSYFGLMVALLLWFLLCFNQLILSPKQTVSIEEAG